MVPLLAALAACLPLLWFALRTASRRRDAPSLPPFPDPPLATAVTVLLPVRNEETHAAACIESLLRLRPPAELVVIDDASSDATAEIIDRWASRDRRVRRVDAPPLPAGWRGKVNGLRRGFEEVATPWTLLVDADARPAPGALARALAHAESESLDGVSLASRQDSGTLGEDLLVPGVFGLLDCLLGDWRIAATGGPCVASGQFLLFRTECFRAAGGFESIRTATIDDVALFEALRKRGGKTGFVRAVDQLQVRMYVSLRTAISGWRRNLAAIVGNRRSTTAAIAATLLAPLLALTVCLVATLRGVPGAWSSCLAVYASGAAASWLNRASAGQRRPTAVLWPAECLLLAVTVLMARRDRRRGRLTSWKGRPVEL
jgi:cellulose synthase/poly-beta-1,6-N-acetylglucosamine synthase-like glycosyltransferase